VVVTNLNGSATSDPAILTVVPTPIEVGDGSGFRTILVHEPGAWAVETDVPWLTVSVSSGVGSRTVEVEFEANKTGADRIGKIEVAGLTYTITQRSSGSGLRELWAMGSNSHGQLGDGTILRRVTPVPVPADVATVSAGYYHSFFLKADGTLWVSGGNRFGKMGDMVGVGSSTPVQIASDVKAVAAGANDSLFVKNDGTLWAMGWNALGELGTGSTGETYVPIQVASDVSAVAVGYTHSMLL
jgi:hypothetical protein